MKNKIEKILASIIATFMLVACADLTQLTFDDFEEPDSWAFREYLHSYGPLKSYIDRANSPNFRLGAATNVPDFVAGGVMYRLLVSNFDQVTLDNAMKHESIVQEDGSFNFGPVMTFMDAANRAEISVHGHTLVWHAQQRASWLNSLIAPIYHPAEPGEPTWDEVITNGDFAGDDFDTSFETRLGTTGTRDFVSPGADGTGRALRIQSPVRTDNPWGVEFFIKLPNFEAGQVFTISMDVRSDVNARFPSQAHRVPGGFTHWAFIGYIYTTPQWTTIERTVTVESVHVGNHGYVGAIAFHLGHIETTVYFDNISVLVENAGGTIIHTQMVTNGNFATDNFHSFELRRPAAEGGGLIELVDVPGRGRVWRIPSPTRTSNPWGREFFIRNFDPRAQEGNVLFLSMDIRAAATPAYAINVQTHSTPGNAPHIGAGQIHATTEWQTIEMRVPIGANRVGDTPGVSTLCFHVGWIETTLYVDNISVILESVQEGWWEYRTPEAKKEILTEELERWITAMLEEAPDVRSWDVVNEPMSNWPDPSQLKTAPANPAANEFFWQDYLGKEYAAIAIEIARRVGRPDIQLFINDYGLEGGSEIGYLPKLDGLLAFIEYTESHGVTVDGIGTQMHISLDTRRENITLMFERLAATGKLIKVTELDIGLGIIDKDHPEPWNAPVITTPMATPELLREQAELYHFVVQQYFAIIPPAQRAGITIWSPLDSPDTAGAWRRNEPVGLWTRTQGFLRKPAYAGFAQGLAGRPFSLPQQ